MTMGLCEPTVHCFKFGGHILTIMEACQFQSVRLQSENNYVDKMQSEKKRGKELALKPAACNYVSRCVYNSMDFIIRVTLCGGNHHTVARFVSTQ